MISSVFKKSTPLNLILVVFLVLVFFLIYQFQDFSWLNSSFLIFKKAVLFTVLLASVFIINFIVKRNGMSKDSSYTIFFYFLFLLFFPSLFNNINLIASNFFVLLALRRLISLQSLKASKEKIFDASLWIFVAALFHFWSILYIGLVFVSILFMVSKDYRNWFLPFIALFAVSVVFVLFSIISDINIIEFFKTNVTTSKINY